MLNISCTLLNTVWEIKTEKLCGQTIVVSVLVVYSHDWVAWLGTGSNCHCSASQESIILLITRQGKYKNLNFEFTFLLNANRFQTIIKLKHCKSNHCVRQCLYYQNESHSIKIDTVLLYSIHWESIRPAQIQKEDMAWGHENHEEGIIRGQLRDCLPQILT